MSIEEVTAYLKTWARLNAREVYGSPRSYIHLDDLTAELGRISELDS